jgi:hypothetical protein
MNSACFTNNEAKPGVNPKFHISKNQQLLLILVPWRIVLLSEQESMWECGIHEKPNLKPPVFTSVIVSHIQAF